MVVLDPFVTFLLNRIGTVIDDEVRLLRGLKGKIKVAQWELRQIKAFLRDADESASRGNHQVRDCVGQIREACWDLEDLLTFLFDKAEERRHRRMSLQQLNIFSSSKVASELVSIADRLSNCRSCLQTNGVQETAGVAKEVGLLYLNNRQIERRRCRPIPRESDFSHDALRSGVEQLAGELLRSDDDCHRFFSICGMGGIGKTTLARHVYHHALASGRFNRLAWVQIFPHLEQQQVWRIILKSLLSGEENVDVDVNGDEAGVTSRADRIRVENDVDNVDERLSQVLKEDKCLVVLDDVWHNSTWCCLNQAFVGGLEESRILITTRNKEVLSSAGIPRSFVYEPPCLDENQSWDLFARKADFEGTNAGDSERMKEIAKKMLQLCGGLPLAIEVLAGVLSSRERLHEWELVDRNVESYLRSGDINTAVEPWQYKGVLWVLSLSYDDLSYPLKQCFLHLAHFREDIVNTKELHRIWMAEGMVSSEDEASEYFDKLVSRYMVQVTKRSSISGAVKEYRIHSLIRDLCFTKTREENFLQVSDFVNTHRGSDSEYHHHHHQRKPQRLAVHVDDSSKETCFH